MIGAANTPQRNATMKRNLTREQVERLVGNATPGPWKVSDFDEIDEIDCGRGMWATSFDRSNTYIIVAAPDFAADWLAMDDEIARLRETISNMCNKISKVLGHIDEGDYQTDDDLYDAIYATMTDAALKEGEG